MPIKQIRVDAFGAWTRRIIVLTVLFGVIIAPFILAHSEEGVTVASEYKKWFGFLHQAQHTNTTWIYHTPRD